METLQKQKEQQERERLQKLAAEQRAEEERKRREMMTPEKSPAVAAFIAAASTTSSTSSSTDEDKELNEEVSPALLAFGEAASTSHASSEPTAEEQNGEMESQQPSMLEVQSASMTEDAPDDASIASSAAHAASTSRSLYLPSNDDRFNLRQVVRPSRNMASMFANIMRRSRSGLYRNRG